MVISLSAGLPGSPTLSSLTLRPALSSRLTEDFLSTSLDGPFEVVLALGLFDYLPDAARFAGRMAEVCGDGGCMVGSFPAWSPVKGGCGRS